MQDFVQAFITAFTLSGSFDSEIVGIVAPSLRVSLLASVIAMVIGAPLGGALAVGQFRGRQAVIVRTCRDFCSITSLMRTMSAALRTLWRSSD
jgi:tungstate transport system permease protein